jgi:hypothetical protein
MDMCRKFSYGSRRMGKPLFILLLTLSIASISAAGVAGPITVIKKVGPEGQGNEAATVAWRELTKADASRIPAILESMNGANELALNWLRSAVETIANRSGPGNLPLSRLERYLRNTSQHPRGRSLALELIRKANGSKADALVPTFLDDPAPELRRLAVSAAAAQADAARKDGKQAEAITRYRAVLAKAREADQVNDITKNLRELKETVDLPVVFGWVTNWMVLGPFDSAKGVGFARAYPPEDNPQIEEAAGRDGVVRWKPFNAAGDYGTVDFNKPFGSLKGLAGYARTDFYSDKPRKVEIRIGSENAWKLWLNGKYLFGQEEYHRGAEIDQYKVPCELKAGHNVLLMKLCQDELVEDWTKTWEFQLRITDELGTPIISSK